MVNWSISVPEGKAGFNGTISVPAGEMPCAATVSNTLKSNGEKGTEIDFWITDVLLREELSLFLKGLLFVPLLSSLAVFELILVFLVSKSVSIPLTIKPTRLVFSHSFQQNGNIK